MNKKKFLAEKEKAQEEQKTFFGKLREKLKWLDPFTYVDKFLMPKVNPSGNEHIALIVYLVSAFVFAWLLYTGLGIAFGTPSPMMIVVSGSMEPLYHRGDVIVLFGAKAEDIQAQEIILNVPSLKETGLYQIAAPRYEITGTGLQIKEIQFNNGTVIPIEKTGTIIVYFSQRAQEPIVHRAIVKIKAQDGYYFLTKGDSIFNNTIDQDCGRIFPTGTEKACINLYPVHSSEIQGKSVFQIPFVGCAKLWLFDDLFSLISKGKLPADFSGIC